MTRAVPQPPENASWLVEDRLAWCVLQSPRSFGTHMRPKGQRLTKEPLAGSAYTMRLGYDRTNDGPKDVSRILQESL